jgi:hypothetical protein
MTRRIAMFVGLLLAWATPGLAQGTFGLKGGVAISSLDTDDAGFDDSRVGVTAGAFVDLPITPIVSIQPEVLFTQKGATGSESGIDFTVHLDYVEIPVLGVVHFGRPGATRPFVAVGPYFGFNTTAKLTTDDFDDDTIDEDIKSADVGVVIAGGLAFRRFGIEARYALGLKDIDSLDFGETKNRTLSFLVSYGFGR